MVNLRQTFLTTVWRGLKGMATVIAITASWRFSAVAVVALVVTTSVTWAGDPSDSLLEKLKPQGYVNDYAEILASADHKKLDSQVTELRRKTGVQLVIVTLKSLEGNEIDAFTTKLFNKWGVGEKGKNNGLMILVAIEDRRVRIEVGYGLEPIVTNALAKRIIDEQMVPSFKQKQYAKGISQAVEKIAGIVEQHKSTEPSEQQHQFTR